MKITIRQPNSHKEAVFTWTDDLENCDVFAVGFSDDEIDAMIEAGAHEGAAFNGYTIEVL